MPRSRGGPELVPRKPRLRTSSYGASRPLRRIPAIVSFLNPKPALSLGVGNRASCPIPAIRNPRRNRPSLVGRGVPNPATSMAHKFADKPIDFAASSSPRSAEIGGFCPSLSLRPGWGSFASRQLRLSLPQRLVAIAHEGRHYIRDDTPLAGFDFGRHGHPRFERQRTLFGFHPGLGERDPRDIGGVRRA